MKDQHCHLIELDYIMQKIDIFKEMRSQKNKAILDATKINPVNLHGDRVISDQRNDKVDKLKIWLK